MKLKSFVFVLLVSFLTVECKLQPQPQPLPSQRPVYIIAHRVNGHDEPGKMLEAGANALEIDLRYETKNGRWCVNHDTVKFCDEDSISKWFDALKKLPESILKKISLIYFDIKDNGGHSSAIKQLQNYINNEFQQDSSLTRVKKVFSVAKYEDRGFLEPLYSSLSVDEFVLIGQESDFVKSIDYFIRHGVSNFCAGNGVFVYLPTTQKIRDSIAKAVEMRDRNNERCKPQCVFSWTYARESTIEEFLEVGVDGLLVGGDHLFITDKGAVENMVNVINSKTKWRKAKRSDPFCEVGYGP